MVDKTTEQLMYEWGLSKFTRDPPARIEYAREEGFREGYEKGLQDARVQLEAWVELLGGISLLKELLELHAPTEDELASYELPQLTELRQQLLDKYRSRPQQ